MLATLEMLPIKFARLQLLRVEHAESGSADPTGETEPLFTDLEAIEEVFASASN